jgi:ATP-binding cassette subfamily B multidrug efflux pump
MSKERRQSALPRGFGHGGRRAGMMVPGAKVKDFKGTLIRLLRYLRPHLFLLLIVFTVSVLGTVLSVLAPKILGQVTTILFAGTMQGAGIDFGRIKQILLFLGGLYLLIAALHYISQFIMAGVVHKTIYALRENVNKKLSQLPLKYFDTQSHGEILSRVTNDMDLIGSTLQQSLTNFMTSLVTVIGVLAMMLSISPVMTLILLGTLPLAFLITSRVARQSQKRFAAQQKRLGELNGHVEEMFSGHTIVKSFSMEEKATRHFQKINEKLYNAGWRAHFISSLIMPLIGLVNNSGYVLICIFGGLYVIQGKMPLGDIQAFIQYSRQFREPIAQFAGIAGIIQATFAAAERVFELLDEKEEVPDKKQARSLTAPRGDVSFENVRFGYSEEVILIKDLNIDVKAGQTVAIVGPTGAGKTTLVNLLMRFYEISGGRITIDGVDIRDIRRGDLRKTFGMVLQDTWLFKGTIRDNIAYGKEGATDEEIIRAAKAAYADHFIRTLPDGYATVLDEEASNISQGQKQLLTIARAILVDPAILILDEATSSVDTRTELLIQKAMAALMKGRTSFVIAHRLSTIHHADMILVMRDGDVVEKGTSIELLALNGFYAELHRSQFSTAV